MPHAEIDWASAEVHDRELVVALTDAAPATGRRAQMPTPRRCYARVASRRQPVGVTSELPSARPRASSATT